MDSEVALQEEISLVETGANTNKQIQSPFVLRDEGVYFQERSRKGLELKPVCSYLRIESATLDSHNENWGRILVVKDPNGNFHSMNIPMSLLSGDGSEVRARLLELGLFIYGGDKSKSRLIEYILTHPTSSRTLCVKQIGWHIFNGLKSYVLPTITFGNEQVVIQSNKEFGQSYSCSGTLEEWKKNIGQYCRGNSRLILSVSAAFAAPTLKLLDFESGGIHLRGNSSIGKSTTLKVGGSVWGGGDRGYIKQWRSTSNGVEAIAAEHCDALLCLDEIAQASDRDVGECAYMLANGAGKQRAKQDGTARKTFTWRLIFLSNGEMSLADKLAAGGFRTFAGQEVRIVDVPAAPAQTSYGLFENIFDFESPQTLADHLSSASKRYFGTPIHAFLHLLVCSEQESVSYLDSIVKTFESRFVPKDAGGQVKRVLRRFALLAAAGELAIRNHILPLEQGDAIIGCNICFQDWLGQRGSLDASEITDGLDQVKSFLQIHSESRFSLWDHAENTIDQPSLGNKTFNRAGFRRKVESGYDYYIFSNVFQKEICKGFDHKLIEKVLLRLGFLKPSERNDGRSKQRLPGDKDPTRVYVISSKFLFTE